MEQRWSEDKEAGWIGRRPAGRIVLGGVSAGVAAAVGLWAYRAMRAKREEERIDPDRMTPVVSDFPHYRADAGLPVPTEHALDMPDGGLPHATIPRRPIGADLRPPREHAAAPKAERKPTPGSRMSLGSEEMRDHDFPVPKTAQSGAKPIPAPGSPPVRTKRSGAAAARANRPAASETGAIFDERLTQPDMRIERPE